MSSWPISEPVVQLNVPSEKEKSLEMLCEFERQVRDKLQLETKINDLQGKLQEAMKEASQSGMLLQGNQILNITELKLMLQGTSALADQLQIELDGKHKLELTIEELKGKFLVDQINQSLKDQLQEINDDIGSLEELNKTLITKERQSNDEVVEARKQLLQAFDDIPSGLSSIGIKRMGEIDIEPFRKALEVKNVVQEVETKAEELCSFWREMVRDPCWFPFKVMNGDDSVPKEILDENDELLNSLKESGAEIYEAVTNALKELNEYNRSGRYVVYEIWNFKENRKAKAGETIAHIANQLKMPKRKRR